MSFTGVSKGADERTVLFGGTSVLIVVSVTLDTVAQLQSHLLAYQYEGLIEKSRLGRKSKRQSRFRR